MYSGRDLARSGVIVPDFSSKLICAKRLFFPEGASNDGALSAVLTGKAA
jgi:hypothetical protein